MNINNELEYILDKLYIQSYERDLYQKIRICFVLSPNSKHNMEQELLFAAELYLEARQSKKFIQNVYLFSQIKYEASVIYLPFYKQQN